MEWLKQHARVLTLLVTLILSIGAVTYTVGSAIQKSNDNKETINNINQELDKLPTPEQLEALNTKLDALNTKLGFLVDFIKEQQKTTDKQFAQIEKRIDRLERKIDRLNNK